MFPSGVTAIYSYAFEDCTILENIIISDSIYEIDNYAFKNCAKLQNVVILSCNADFLIGDHAFNGCVKLSKVFLKLFHYNSTSWGDERFHPEFSKAKRYYYMENDPEVLGTYWHFDIDGRTILEW
ncbi:MAG: leucine-rich repeat domain-containing protein [Clostridia bacterium]|nr:leucine-rich repeat domain-containing protein [Clostridia bacterium]